MAAALDLPADRIARYRELDADRVIREAIESELTPGGGLEIGALAREIRARVDAVR